MIRFTVTSSHTKLSVIERDWDVIKSIAGVIIDACADHMINMAGDDQLEENGADDDAEAAFAAAAAAAANRDDAAIRPKTKRVLLAGNNQNAVKGLHHRQLQAGAAPDACIVLSSLHQPAVVVN